MHYIDKTLAEGEEIIKFFHLSKYVFLGTYLTLLLAIIINLTGGAIYLQFINIGASPPNTELISGGILLVGVLLGFKSSYSLLLLKSINMGITDKRIVLKRGIISINTDEIRMNAIETVEVNQSILGRILGYGDISVTGRGESDIKFIAIDEPLEIKRVISASLNAVQR